MIIWHVPAGGARMSVSERTYRRREGIGTKEDIVAEKNRTVTGVHILVRQTVDYTPESHI